METPGGTKFDFNLTIDAERAAYQDWVQHMPLHSFADDLANARAQRRAAAAEPTQFRLTEVFETFKKSKAKTYSGATKAGYFPRIQAFIDFYQRPVLNSVYTSGR